MDKDIKIALITTVYNDSKYIKKLLVSLLNQTSYCFKHYIFEDGSKETSEEIINWYKKDILLRKLPIEVEYIKSDINLGVDKGHEFLFRMVREDYFCWVDSDDWLEKDFCSTVLRCIKKNPIIDIFHINSSQYDSNYKVINKSTMSFLSKNVQKATDQFPAYCLGGQRFFHNFVIKTESFRIVNPEFTIFPKDDNQVFWYDAQILFEMCLFHAKYKLIKKPLSCILNRPTSVSRNERHLSTINRQKDFESLKYIINKLRYDKKDTEMFFELFEKTIQYYEKLTWNSIKSNYEDSKRFYKEYKAYIKNLRLPSNYINLKKGVDVLLFRRKYYFVIRFIKCIISFFKKNDA